MKILKSSGAFGGGQRVFIAIPTYRDICPETVQSLFGAKECLLRNGIESELCIASENCHVDDGRNYLVREFLESKCSQMIFVDADVRFDPEDIVRLALYDRDVVVGVYPKKADEDYPVLFLGGDIWSDEAGLIEIAGGPTGFMKIRRIVLEKLYEKVPKYVPENEGLYHELRIPIIFERTLRGFTRLGGDYEFCRKWKEMGGAIYADPLMTFGHSGSTDHTGSLASHLIKKNNLSEAYISDFYKKLSSGKAEARDYLIADQVWGSKWSALPDMLMASFDIASSVDGKILELGSGLSTIVLGASGKKVISLEHDRAWYEKVMRCVNLCGMDNVEVVLCELKDGFYDYEFDEYAMVFVDGPPKNAGKRLPVVEKIKNKGVFVVDDVNGYMSVVNALSEKFGAKFKTYGRYAIGG